MNQLMKSWPALLILIGGVLAAWGSWVSSNKNDQQQEAIQKTGEENTTLGKNNEQLSTEIQKLQRVNADVINHTKDLVVENKRIASENLDLTDKTKKLTENVEALTTKVDELLEKVHKQITGGNSIPIVSIAVSFYPQDPYARWRGAQISELVNRWIVEFKISNSGNFPLTNIRLHKTTQGVSVYPNTVPLSTIDILGPHETKTFFPTIIIEDNKDAFIVSHLIKVEWSAISYTCKTFVEKRHVIDTVMHQSKWEYYNRDTQYHYKDKDYKTESELKLALQNDLE